MRSPIAVVVASLLAAALALGVPVISASPASASEGSVPLQVTELLAGSELGAKLTELYGPATDAAGVDFSDATFSSPSRIFVFTAGDPVGSEDSSGGATAEPTAPSTRVAAKPQIRRINEWAVVVTVAKKVIGVATVAYPTGSTVASLAGFSPDAALAAALPKLAPAAALLRDVGNEAWMSVAKGTATPLVAGSTGLTAPVSLEKYPRAVRTIREPAAPAPSDPASGLIPASVIVVLVLVIFALLLVRMRGRRSEFAHRDPIP